MSVKSVRPDIEQGHLLIRKSEAGFTLLEIMVAVAIIAISFVSLLGSQSQSISIATISRFEITASMLARQKLAEIQTADFEELTAAEGDFEDNFADFHWQTEVSDLTEDETGITGADEMLKVVDLAVSRGIDDDMVYRVRSVIMAKIKPVEKE
jgi:general secretion pathway protein I